MKFEVMTTTEIAARIADSLAAQLKEKPDSVLGMTTGSSPIKYGIFQEWIRREEAGELDFAEATFINPDELIGISPDHPESYRTFMQEQLFQHLRTKQKAAHIPDGSVADLDQECRRFDQVLRDLQFADWQLMGLGLNGHIAFIEPADAIPVTTYVADIYEQNRPYSSVHFRSPAEVPSRTITIGLEAVMKARAIVLVAAGANKADIVAEAFQGPVTTRIPASLLQLHPNVTIILDEGSASKLTL
ncbi:6-phosphogluconolactonase [Paenibacillus albus]|uniref:Glucosamine-6-phosphate deaminase n=1 Tax=Paenibacillus albus TaxID=2495582 RepID=A0A3Q8X2L5_9BACL|nr:glucosamine-6-phosphate deaminase [Paenibacillus albus]AZN39053.1 glucosamine-6-phosphate deaminase [Paenibacillus albus]